MKALPNGLCERMPIQIDQASASGMAARFDEALVLVRNEFKGLDVDSQYRNAFARLLRQDPLERVPMLGTDQRDRFVPVLRELFACVPAGGHILDVGGGNGQTLALLADRLPERVTVSLIEPNAGYVDDYRRWLESQQHLDAGRLIVAGLDDVDALPSPDQASLEDGSAHLVLALHMLYFVADPAASLLRMARFLKPGGALAVVFADEVRGYSGQVLQRFVEAGGDTGNNAEALAGVEARERLTTGTRLADAINAQVHGEFQVEIQLQSSRLYCHTLGDLIALSAIAELAATESSMKFEVAADLLRSCPEAVDLRIEDEGPRKGMWSVTQPQRLAIIRRLS